MYHTFETIIIPGIISLVLTFIALRFLMVYLYGAGVVGEDHNKEKTIKLPSSGGLAVVFGIIVGILVYIFGGTFIFTSTFSTSTTFTLLAVALSIVLIGLVGFIDDINVKGERVKATGMMDIKEGLKQWQKPLLTFIGALPLMAISAGVSVVMIPFIGTVNFGIWYPLVILPLAIIFVSNAVNLLGGFDGLQAGTTFVASIGLLIYTVLFGTYVGALLSMLLVTAIFAFLYYNWQGKVIPGDSFSYAVGATMVAIIILGRAEAFGTIIFIPWIIEFFLHLRKKFKVTDIGIRQKDGTFKAPYGKKIYSLTHLVMNLTKPKEKDVTLYLCALEVIVVVAALALHFFGWLR